MELKGSTRRAAGNWEIAFGMLARDIEEQFGIPIEYAALDVKRGQVSLNEDGRPRLNRTPELRYLGPCSLTSGSKPVSRNLRPNS